MESDSDTKILSIDHIQLAMPKGEESRAESFYCGLLGFRRVPKPPKLERKGGCWFEANNVRLHLGVETPFVPARKAHPAFIIRDLNSMRVRLEENGHEVVFDSELSGYTRFFTYDPFGNRIEMMEPILDSHSSVRKD